MSKNKCTKQVHRGFCIGGCSRNAWKDGFCKQHHPDSVKQRNAEAHKVFVKRYEEKKAAAALSSSAKESAWYKLQEAEKRISELQKKLRNAHKLLDKAWGVISRASVNVNGWGDLNPAWQKSADRWRDDWLKLQK